MSGFRFLLSAFCFLLLVLTYLGCPPAQAADQPKAVFARFSLRDYLNRNWHNELVFFKTEARLVGRRDVALLDADQHPVPFQWQTGSTAGIAFLASVPSFAQVEYSLVERIEKRGEGRGQGAEGGNQKAETRKQKPEDGRQRTEDRNITIKDLPDSVELGNDNIGIRLNRGTKALREGPIGGIRLTSGKWVGAGELHWAADSDKRTGMSALRGDAGETATLPSCRVKVVADGPVYADVESEYTFPNKEYWRLRFRVISGEPVVLVGEDRKST